MQLASKRLYKTPYPRTRTNPFWGVLSKKLKPDGLSENINHNSLVSKIEYNIKTLNYRFTLMDSAKHGGFSLDKLKSTFSVWKMFSE